MSRSKRPLAAAVPWICAALLIAVCLAMPLLFISPAEPAPTGEGLTDAVRAELYRLHTEDEDYPFERLDEDEVASEDIVECLRVVNDAASELVMDAGETRVDGPDGMNFYTVTGDEGSIRVLEYYHEWTGDWHNWFTMHMDIDTREIYYLYYSASLQRSGLQYVGRAEEHLDRAGHELSAALGLTVEGFEQVDDTRWEMTLGGGSGDRVYDVVCNIYEDAAPSMIIDLRLTLKEIAA